MAASHAVDKRRCCCLPRGTKSWAGYRIAAVALAVALASGLPTACGGGEQAAGPGDESAFEGDGSENSDGAPEPESSGEPVVLGPPEPTLLEIVLEGACGKLHDLTAPLVEQPSEAAVAKGRLWLGIAAICRGEPGAAADDISFALAHRQALPASSQEVAALLDAGDLPEDHAELVAILAQHPQAEEEDVTTGEEPATEPETTPTPPATTTETTGE